MPIITMEIRIKYSIEGYIIEEIIDSDEDELTDEIISNLMEVYVFKTGEILSGVDAVNFIRLNLCNRI